MILLLIVCVVPSNSSNEEGSVRWCWGASLHACQHSSSDICWLAGRCFLQHRQESRRILLDQDDLTDYTVMPGARYNLYCANVARSYLVDPSKTQQDEYAAVLAAMEAATKALVPGVPCSDAYNAAVKALEVGAPTVAPVVLRRLSSCTLQPARAVIEQDPRGG